MAWKTGHLFKKPMPKKLLIQYQELESQAFRLREESSLKLKEARKHFRRSKTYENEASHLLSQSYQLFSKAREITHKFYAKDYQKFNKIIEWNPNKKENQNEKITPMSSLFFDTSLSFC